MPSHQPLSSFPPVLARIVHFADTSTRLTLLRTTYQLHHLVGPLVYREVYLDKKTLAGVFLGWDVEESAVDGEGGMPRTVEAVTKETKGAISKLVATIARRGNSSRAKKQKTGTKHPKETDEAKVWAKGAGRDPRPNDNYKPIKNFKAALLRHIKIATITEHCSTHCEALAFGGASSLLSLDVLRVVQPWVDHFTTLSRLCEFHETCHLMLAFDTKKIVFRNLKCSGFPLDIEDFCFWHPPSLEQVVCFLAADGSTTSEESLALQRELSVMFINLDRVKIVFLDRTETTAWDRQYEGPPLDGMGMSDLAPLHAKDLVGIIRLAQLPGRVLEVYGLEGLEFDWLYSSQSLDEMETEDDGGWHERIRREIMRPNVSHKNTKANMIIRTLDEYWAGGDWKGEVNQQEIASRIEDQQRKRKKARRNDRWLKARASLRGQFEAGELEDGFWTPTQGDFEEAEAPYWFYRDDPDGMDEDDEVTL